jgi:hypothetical protein
MTAEGVNARTLRRSRSGRVDGGCVGHAPSSFETRALRAPQDEAEVIPLMLRSRQRRRLEALEATPIAKPGGGARAGLNSVGQRPGRRGRLTPELIRPR